MVLARHRDLSANLFKAKRATDKRKRIYKNENVLKRDTS